MKLLLITTIHFLLPYGPFQTQYVAGRKINFFKWQVKVKVKQICMHVFQRRKQNSPTRIQLYFYVLGKSSYFKVIIGKDGQLSYLKISLRYPGILNSALCVCIQKL